MTNRLFHILMVFAMIFWGASWISTKVLTNYVNEYELVFLRMGICFISMFPLICFFKLSFKFDLKSFIFILIASVILTLYSIVMFLGVQHGTASFGGALVTTLIPIITFILIALLKKQQTQQGSHISVSLFDSAIASLANQATNWLIAHHLPVAQGSLHPNIAPYGELFSTQDHHTITFAIGSNAQFKKLCDILNLNIYTNDLYASNQQRVKNRDSLFQILNTEISKIAFDTLFHQCLQQDVPIGKIRNLKEVFELPEAQAMLHHFTYQNNNLTSVKSVAFKFH